MSESTATAPEKGAATYTPGAFVWHELGTTDVGGAEKFYSALFGWRFDKMPMGDMQYWMLFAGDRGVGGMYPLGPDQGGQSYWMGTVSVPDVDATAKVVEQAGGKVLVQPGDVPDMVRYAVFMDPQGAAFGVCRSVNGDPPTDMPSPGEFCWDQLNTSDPAAAGAFYNKVIGWDLAGDEATGFQVFKMGDLQEASVVKTEPAVPSHWMSHIVVPDLPAAIAKVQSLGGKVLVDRIAVPGMGAFGVVQDPQGAIFSMFSGEGAM